MVQFGRILRKERKDGTEQTKRGGSSYAAEGFHINSDHVRKWALNDSLVLNAGSQSHNERNFGPFWLAEKQGAESVSAPLP